MKPAKPPKPDRLRAPQVRIRSTTGPSKPSIHPLTRSTSTPTIVPEKRYLILQELYETEKSHLSDLKVLLQVYEKPSEGILPVADRKLLFSNIPLMIAISTQCSQGFEKALEDGKIGDCFLFLIKDIEQSYTTYCKHNDACLLKITEYSNSNDEKICNFLSEAQKNLKGKTNAWDLASLIVKPVQRVLKYPLLIKQLLECTPPSHYDFVDLSEAYVEIERVATSINETKKRVDIVEKYVGGKGSVNVMHGITKKLTRSRQQLMKVTGLADSTNTIDVKYEDLNDRFLVLYDSINVFKQDIMNWIKCYKTYFDILESISEALYVLLESEESRLFSKACSKLMGGPWKEMDTKCKKIIYPHFDTLIDLCKGPLLIQKKHDAKKLDFERVQLVKSKGEPIDKLLQESADSYEAIHALLLDELPIFLRLVCTDIHHICLTLACIYQEFLFEFKSDLLPLAQNILKDLNYTEEIQAQFQMKWAIGGVIHTTCSSISLLHNWCNKMWNLSTPSTPSLVDLSGKPAPKPVIAPIDGDSILRSNLSTTPLAPTNIVIAKFAFTPEYEDELPLEKNDRIRVIKKQGRGSSTDWWYGETRGRLGWFPKTFVE